MADRRGSASTLAGFDGPVGVTAARVRYVIDLDLSRFTIQAFSGGMLSALGHNPKFVARDFGGDVTFDPDQPDAATMNMTMRAASLTLVDDVSERDRQMMLKTMQEDVLESSRFPEIAYRCPQASVRAARPGQFEVRLDGELTLHGVTRHQPISANLSVSGPVLRAAGEFTVRQSDYNIEPVTVAASMLKVKDELRCSFDISARRSDGGDE
jgi:polyisoprenoid-binding protein YceI